MIDEIYLQKELALSGVAHQQIEMAAKGLAKSINNCLREELNRVRDEKEGPKSKLETLIINKGVDIYTMYLTLSNRESQIFIDALSGKSNKQIAQKFNLALKTVEAHRANCYKKLNVRSTSEFLFNLLLT